MVKIYSSWTDDQYEEFVSQDWVIDGNDSWWEDMICGDIKQEWTFDQFMNLIQSDIDEDLSITQITQKYLK